MARVSKTSKAKSPAGAEEVDLGGAAPVVTKLPTAEPMPPFVLMHHPLRWRILKGEIAPELRRFFLIPGVADLDQVTGWRKAVARLEEEGWVVLPETKAYLRRQRVKGGYRHHAAWESTHALTSRVTVDRAAELAFVKKLKLKAPEPYQLLSLQASLATRRDDAARRMHSDPRYRTECERLDQHLQVVTDAIEGLGVQARGEKATPEDVGL